jgi:hypothetical protein
MIITSNKDFCEIYLKTLIGESIESEKQKPEETPNVDELTEENTITIAEDTEEDTKADTEEPTTEVEATISTEDDDMAAEEDETITEDDDEDDGWDEETIELLSDIMEDGESLYYELKNCKRGTYTNCTDHASLGEYLKEYANRIIEIAEEMTNNTTE